MKVILTHAYFLEEDPKELKIMRPYPPLGLLYIAAFLEANGIAAQVFDTTFSTRDELKNYLRKEQPQIIAFYVNLMTKKTVLELIAFVRTEIPRARIVLGGPEIRHSAENFLRYGAHYAVIGEGEQTMLELTVAIGSDAAIDAVAGVGYLSAGIYTQTPEREKLKDLDALPLPAREKIDIGEYLRRWKLKHGASAMSVSTMRGCPYTCKWCSRAVYGLSYRRRSPARVAEELVELKRRYNPDSFWFVDDVFTISHKWLREFRDALSASGVSIRYECITRADRMNDEVIRLLKDTGCFRVWIGAESGSQKVIDLMDRRVSVLQVREMIRKTREHGIEAGTFIMLGYPGESEADIEETIVHLKESNPDHFTITVAYPIRGTELFDEVQSDIVDDDWAGRSDREIDFRRTYRRAYYQWAIRRVVNEVTFSRLPTQLSVTRARVKIKLMVATWMMRLLKGRFS